ncbi:MAG: SxtJ family membrane protein [Gemmatimonadota bacterium]
MLEDCLLLKAAQSGSEGDGARWRAPSVPPHPWTWPEPEPDRDPTSHLRKFGLVMTVGFGLLGLLFWWRGVPAAPWMAGIGAAFLAVGLVSPRILGPVERGWMWLAEKLGAVMTRVLLTITFFLGVTPLALLGRLLGRDRLAIRSFGRSDAGTFWQDVDPDGPVSRPDEPY